MKALILAVSIPALFAAPFAGYWYAKPPALEQSAPPAPFVAPPPSGPSVDVLLCNRWAAKPGYVFIIHGNYPPYPIGPNPNNFPNEAYFVASAIPYSQAVALYGPDHYGPP